MIKIDLLKNHPESIYALANIWYSVLGRICAPNTSIECIVQRFSDHLNDKTLPITLVALDEHIPIGMCSLRVNDGIRPDLSPWLGSLVVDQRYQKRGVGKMLVDRTIIKARQLGFKELYLFALDPVIPPYYEKLG
jgi:N-acetylglutamate synthase-like GNAT family acetyltransferase